MAKLEFNGMIYRHNRVFRGQIYSTRLARLLKGKTVKVSMKFKDNSVILTKNANGVKLMSHPSSQNVAISVRKSILPETFQKQFLDPKVKNIKVKFILRMDKIGINLSDFEYGSHAELPKEYFLYKITKTDLSNCVMLPASLYKEKAYKTFQYYLDVFSKKFGNKIRNKRVDIRVISAKPLILIILPNGKYKATYTGEHFRVSCKKVLSTFSNELMWNTKNRIRSSHLLVFTRLNDWNLKINDIFIYNEEAVLAKHLHRNFIIGKVAKDDQKLGDIIVFNKRLNPISLIEITNINSIYNRGHGGSASSRLYHLLKSILKGFVKSSFLIVNSSWKEFLEEDEKILRFHNVHIIYTDFKNKWSNSIANKISSIIREA